LSARFRWQNFLTTKKFLIYRTHKGKELSETGMLSILAVA